MLLVRFLSNGYIAANNAGQDAFEELADYQILFDFIETDTSNVLVLLQKYFNSVFNPRSLELTGTKADNQSLDNAMTLLDKLHPFFRYNDHFAVVVEMLAYHLNLCLLLNTHKDEILDLGRYSEYLKALVDDMLLEINVTIWHESDTKLFISYPNKDFIFKNFVKRFYDIYIDSKNGNKTSFIATRGLKYVSHLQNTIKHMIYWLIDSSSLYFGKLTAEQRTRVYRNVFSSQSDSADLKVTKRISISNPRTAYTNPLTDITNIHAKLQSAAENGNIDELIDEYENVEASTNNIDRLSIEALAHLRDDMELEPELRMDLDKAIASVLSEKSEAFFEEYEIETLYQLLFLEIEQLIKNGTIVKRCRHCEKYFVTNNLNVDYCSRIADGETEPCSQIGSTRAFQKKLDEDYPLKIYNRAYKTHYARVKKGNMGAEAWQIWRDEAREKLDLVRSDELDVVQFEKWLKI